MGSVGAAWGALLLIVGCLLAYSEAYNIATSGAKLFQGNSVEEFGYTVRQFVNSNGKWLLVGSPWSGFPQNKMGDIYRCPLHEVRTTCDKLQIQSKTTIQTVTEIKNNMTLGLTLNTNTKTGFMTCGPLWSQQCGSQYFSTGICSEVLSDFSKVQSFSPALQKCGGPMDIAIVLDGSNSIWPWAPIQNFLKKLLSGLNIGPNDAQVSVTQYAVDPSFEFKLNTYATKDQMIAAAAKITQKLGSETNTFRAIDYARKNAFLPENGGRDGASKVMVVVTDGESHDNSKMKTVIGECEKAKITRFGIAVLGYYIRNDIDTKNLISEIKSIASAPSERYFFNVSEEAALSEIAGTLGERIFNIEGTGKGGDNFQMEMSQVGFSAFYSRKEDVMILGAVGAYDWSGTVVHKNGSKTEIFPKQTFEKILEDRNHSSLLGYSVTTLSVEGGQFYVAGAPRSNHTGQVVTYTIDDKGKPTVQQSQRGEQIGSYFGSVLCSVDIDHDLKTDVLLVGAPMFMDDFKKEIGKVYIFLVIKGILGQRDILQGPSSSENARFGMAISAVPDLNLDGLSDVIVGAPLEYENKGAIYVYNGDKSTLRTKYSQKILASDLSPTLQYFGRSLDGSVDLNSDTIPDVSVGAYGNVVQLWSQSIVNVTVEATFSPDKISILNKSCDVSGRKQFCFVAKLCFSATFRPTSASGPVDIKSNFTLDADLQSSRVSSRGLFAENNDRMLQKNIEVMGKVTCNEYKVFVQDAPDFVNSLALRVDIGLQKPKSSPVLEKFARNSWQFFIPFSKDCGEDELCLSDLVLGVQRKNVDNSLAPFVVSSTNARISFTVKVWSKNENAYNSKVIATYSNNLYFSSHTIPTDGTDVKCQLETTESVSCQVGYPALKLGQEVSFDINFDFNINHLQSVAYINFQALSDSTEETPENNVVNISIPVQYNSEIVFTRDTSLHFYEVNSAVPAETKVNTFEDIGPEFNITLKVTTGGFPVHMASLTVALPVSTRIAGNPLLYITDVNTDTAIAVSCETTELLNPLKIREKPYTASFSKEDLTRVKKLDCETANCKSLKCSFKDVEPRRQYAVNITARIWNGTFAVSEFQEVNLQASAEIETSQPDLLIIMNKKLPIEVTITKPGIKKDVPLNVIIGSVIGGLLLLAALVAILYKLGFFKRKYEQLMKNEVEDGDGEIDNLNENES
ncbi:integrin alpha-2 [Erpetoichthys calabaricus]|uniref:Integrin subunit alpha 2 n=1 Tax=Erpetoichthys calabaricus TaxID=27687 RepID=A0A8C4SVC6_ERPCA|nr:integrin alpha-2 [Erpetoichthys calabaricus]